MSTAQQRAPGKPGVISELALARAQRNTVVIVDDLFSSRLLLAEIVRQIDGKLNLELFDTPSRALEYARNNRVDMILTDSTPHAVNAVELRQLVVGEDHVHAIVARVFERAARRVEELQVQLAVDLADDLGEEQAAREEVVDDDDRVPLRSSECQFRDDARFSRGALLRGTHKSLCRSMRGIRPKQPSYRGRQVARMLLGRRSRLRCAPDISGPPKMRPNTRAVRSCCERSMLEPNARLKGREWSGRCDLNTRPSAPHADALPG